MIGETTDSRISLMAELRSERARSEFRSWAMMLDFLDVESARIERDVEPRRQDLAVAAVRSVVAQASGWSEYQTASRLHEAQTVRDDLPRTWVAFGEGRVDGQRVSLIATAAWQLSQQRSLERLDARVVEYAATHTPAELRQWLKRFVARIEPEETERRYEDIVEDRHVVITHDEDGTGSLFATNLPSHVLAGIEQRLDHAAKALTDDPRTLDQRRADLLVDALDHIDPENEPARSPNLAIGVMVPVSTLAGVDDQPAVSADREWIIPANVLRTLAVSGSPFWYRLLVDDSEDILSVNYTGRYPPEHLRNAIRFRDANCRYPGCTTKARSCDIDHRQPLPHGPTNGDNLWALMEPSQEGRSRDGAAPSQAQDLRTRHTHTIRRRVELESAPHHPHRMSAATRPAGAGSSPGGRRRRRLPRSAHAARPPRSAQRPR